MKRSFLAALGAAFLSLVSVSAFASARIEAISVTRSSTAPGTPAQLVLTMKRATPLDLAPCDIAIDPGDGEKPMQVTFGPTDSQSKVVHYTFRKAGSFKVSAKGAGKSACDGERSAEVLVSGPGAAPAAAAGGAAAGCPPGWSVASQEGHKFTCRANPPSTPIKCDGATTYFAEGGAVGCR